jgi:hypothetical protein
MVCFNYILWCLLQGISKKHSNLKLRYQSFPSWYTRAMVGKVLNSVTTFFGFCGNCTNNFFKFWVRGHCPLTGYIRRCTTVGPCHHGMAHPQVTVGGTAPNMEGICEYIEQTVADSRKGVPSR